MRIEILGSAAGMGFSSGIATAELVSPCERGFFRKPLIPSARYRPIIT